MQADETLWAEQQFVEDAHCSQIDFALAFDACLIGNEKCQVWREGAGSGKLEEEADVDSQGISRYNLRAPNMESVVDRVREGDGSSFYFPAAGIYVCFNLSMLTN